jgi:hypothetical protein
MSDKEMITIGGINVGIATIRRSLTSPIVKQIKSTL